MSRHGHEEEEQNSRSKKTSVGMLEGALFIVSATAQYNMGGRGEGFSDLKVRDSGAMG